MFANDASACPREQHVNRSALREGPQSQLLYLFGFGLVPVFPRILPRRARNFLRIPSALILFSRLISLPSTWTKSLSKNSSLIVLVLFQVLLLTNSSRRGHPSSTLFFGRYVGISFFLWKMGLEMRNESCKKFAQDCDTVEVRDSYGMEKSLNKKSLKPSRHRDHCTYIHWPRLHHQQGLSENVEIATPQQIGYQSNHVEPYYTFIWSLPASQRHIALR